MRVMLCLVRQSCRMWGSVAVGDCGRHEVRYGSEGMAWRGQVGDEVVSINDIDVRELSIGTMKQLTVGPVGSWVKLDLLRASLPYTVSLQRLLPTHTSYANAAAAGVLVHAAGGHVGSTVPDGQSVRRSPRYSSGLAGPGPSGAGQWYDAFGQGGSAKQPMVA